MEHWVGGFAMHMACARATLPPMLFIQVMEVMSALFKVDSWELMQPLGVRQIKHRASLYADDIIMFLALVAVDLSLANSIFQMFECALGLVCNMSKCQIAPIHCGTDLLNLATSFFPHVMVEFPI
jgi:hypothetical protein